MLSVTLPARKRLRQQNTALLLRWLTVVVSPVFWSVLVLFFVDVIDACAITANGMWSNPSDEKAGLPIVYPVSLK